MTIIMIPRRRHAPGPQEQYTLPLSFELQHLQRSTRVMPAHAQSHHLNHATFQPSVFYALASSFFPFLSLCPARSNNSPLQYPLYGYESECKSTALSHNRRSVVGIACSVINARRSPVNVPTFDARAGNKGAWRRVVSEALLAPRQGLN